MSIDTPLPADPDVLAQLVIELREQLRAALRAKASLELEVQKLARQLFGRKSERIDPNQLSLPELSALLKALERPVQEPAQPPAQTPPKNTSSRFRRRRPRFEDLPRERQEHPLAPQDRLCPCCDKPRKVIRFEVSEQLEYRPSAFYVIEHARPIAVCAHGCEAAPVIAPKPLQPIDKGLPGPGLLAHVAVSKYMDHLPLNRLERIFKRQGVVVPRSTLCDWIAAIAERLGPIVDYLHRDLLLSRVLATDDTTVPVLAQGQKTTKKGRLWVYLGDDDHPWVVFDYTPTREGSGPLRFLTGYEGFLQADAYSGYDQLYTSGKVLELGCWMHARRYYYEASQSDPGRPCEALAFIRELYAIERRLQEASVEERKAGRIEHAKPLLESFKLWIDQAWAVTPPKSPLGSALGYSMRQWPALIRYAEHGDLNIDNGRSERELRAVAVGRKNWTFAGSDAGGIRAAQLYSVTATCRRNSVDPFEYLRDVLSRLPTHPADRIADLTPLAWKTEQLAREKLPAAASA